METLDCIATRRSIRKFLDIPVEFEKLGNIIDAGRFAPSAGNLQDVKFILVTQKKTQQDIAKACVEQYWVGTAPIIIVVCNDPEKTKRFYQAQGEKYSTLNAGAAIQNMLLAVNNEGLASCWVSAFDESILRSVLNIPDGVLIQGILPIGYADEKVPMPVRLTIENVTYIGSWGNRIRDLAQYMEWYGEHVQKTIAKGKELVKEFARRIQK